MSAAATLSDDLPESVIFRRAADSEQATIFTEIYREDTNISIWRRKLSTALQTSINNFLTSNDSFQIAMTLRSENAFSDISKVVDETELSENICELVDMFSLLFELKQVGLRLTTLDRAMCPKFHFDRVPCRLVTSYHGSATEWLPHNVVDRTKLGAGSKGLSDDKSGLFQSNEDIQQLNTGDVALLKGELWENNENAGLVHRSPEVLAGEKRLLLTLDFIT